MTQNGLVVRDNTAIMEAVIMQGDLAKLTPQQRVEYMLKTCESIGLNPLTRPFEYIQLNGKLTLYARKDAADQLRALKGISIEKPDIRFEDDWIIVTVAARDAAGRTDADVGVVSRKDMQGNFGNALMKAITKAKRRVTLSICGLGMLDETEVETVPQARVISVDHETGEILDAAPTQSAVGSKARTWKPSKVWPQLRKPLPNGPELDRDEIHRALGVASLDEWFDMGKTLEDAISVCCDAAAERAAT